MMGTEGPRIATSTDAPIERPVPLGLVAILNRYGETLQYTAKALQSYEAADLAGFLDVPVVGRVVEFELDRRRAARVGQ